MFLFSFLLVANVIVLGLGVTEYGLCGIYLCTEIFLVVLTRGHFLGMACGDLKRYKLYVHLLAQLVN